MFNNTSGSNIDQHSQPCSGECSCSNNQMQAPKKPPFSFPCLVGMAMRNSKTGRMSVSQIYAYVTKNFPYFRTAKSGWKNSVRVSQSWTATESTCSFDAGCLYCPVCLFDCAPS